MSILGRIKTKLVCGEGGDLQTPSNQVEVARGWALKTTKGPYKSPKFQETLSKYPQRASS